MRDYPKGNIWSLKDMDQESQYYRQDFKFDFTSIYADEVKSVVRTYIWVNYCAGNLVVRALQSYLGRYKIFSSFCNQNNITSLCELNSEIVDDYRSFLRIYISPVTNKPLSYSYQYNCFSALKTLVNWCRVFMPEAVPGKQIFTGSEYRQVSSQLKIDFIPDEVLQAINEALKAESNLYLKHGITILQCTGMRVGDLLGLTIHCISKHPISGHTISWFDYKNRKKRSNMPIPIECKEAVDSLLLLTGTLREQADIYEKKRLFIYKPNIGTNKKPIIVMSKQVFVKMCRDFCKKHDIRDSGGNVFKLTSHMFRRTLATDMFSKGTNLKVIQDVLGHASPAITKKYYADVKDADQAAMFSNIGILGNIGQISEAEIADKTDYQWFKENCTVKARLSDGYCTLPIQDGNPCGYFLSRQKCYVCSRYITTLEDLETHREHLSGLEELLDSNIYGSHFAAHIIPTILALKEIIYRLEKLKDEK